jgi:hypothetical protein
MGFVAAAVLAARSVRMPTCVQCGSRIEAARQDCPKCGAAISAADDSERAEPGASSASTESVTTTGTWSTVPPPRSKPVGRVQLNPRPRAPLRALTTHVTSRPRATSAQRHNAALALDALRRSDTPEPSDASRLEPVSRRHTPAAAEIVPLRPAENSIAAKLPAPTPRPQPDAHRTDSSEPDVHGPARGAPLPAVAPSTGRTSDPPPRPNETGTRLTPSAQSAARPPVLASECLRKDLAPSTPSGRPVRGVTALVGVLGLGIALLLGRMQGLGIPFGGAFAALALLGIVPLAYAARAAAVMTVAGSGLSVVIWDRLGHGEQLDPLIPLIGCCLLAMALLFRSWHRASLLARALVALGIVLCAGWVWMSGALQRLLVLEGEWQSWLPALLVVPLVILLLLALLAFMDSRSTGGCALWSALVLAWYALYAWLDLIELAWPASAAHAEWQRVSPEIAITLISGPLFAVALVLALAQLLAVATADAD